MFLVDRIYLIHQSDNHFLLNGVFNSFTFNIIIGVVEVESINLLFVFSLSHSCFFSFVYNCITLVFYLLSLLINYTFLFCFLVVALECTICIYFFTILFYFIFLLDLLG